MQVYTFDFLVDSQDFNHNEEFVLREDLDSELELRQKEIQSLKAMIVECRPWIGSDSIREYDKQKQWLKDYEERLK